MAQETTTWTPAEAQHVGDQWDAMVVARGDQADPYATHAWFDAWVRAEPDVASRVAVHAVVDDGEPVALWPLVRHRGAWTSTNVGNAPRTRLVVGPEPDAGTLDALVAQVARSGVRRLRLHGLPTRDPSTDLLLAALRSHGYAVEARQTESDNVVRVAGSEAFDRTVRKLTSSSRSRERRVTRFWDVEVRTFGGEARSLVEGMELFDVVQGRSWKGPHRPEVARRRRLFLEAADRHGWVHLLVLTIGERPAAGNIWFGIGDVAIGWSTCFDQQLAALAPGLLLHRHVQEAVHDAAPALLDVLPGPNPFKESLDVERPPLLTVEAHRRSGADRLVVPAARWGRRTAVPALRQGVGRVRSLRRRGNAPIAAPGPVTDRVAPDLERPRVAVTTLAVDAAFSRYLAVAAGHPSADAAASGWGPDDRWLLVGEHPHSRALARLAPPEGDLAGVVREVVPLAAGSAAEDVAGAVADALGRPVGLQRMAGRGAPPLPWVDALATPTGPLG